MDQPHDVPMEHITPEEKPKITRITLLFAGVILLLISVVAYFLLQQRTQERVTNPDNIIYDTKVIPPTSIPETIEPAVFWDYNGTDWQVFGTPPECPTPLFVRSPVDLTNATSILYPGQTRGGNYKPHGGFRFDTVTDNLVNVYAPMDAKVVRGSRYLVNGEVQYTFDFVNPCGIMYRLGHLLTLAPSFQQIAETFPPAREGDSRTTRVEPPVAIKHGDLIATAIGTNKDQNTFVDFGVYDLRTKNEASKNEIWATQHGVELDQHGVCWFDLLPEAEQIKALPPGDPASGKNSDYCK